MRPSTAAVMVVCFCACAHGQVATGVTYTPTVVARATRDPYPLEAATEAERELFNMLNAERQRVGLPALSWNGSVSLLAREHSEAAREGDVSDLETTLRGRVEMTIAANVARAALVANAHAAFMENLRQRANILSAKFNQVGIGVVEDRSGSVIVTEIIVRATPPANTGAIAEQLKRELPAYELRASRDLDRIAQAFADALAAGKTVEQIWPRLRSQIHEIDRRYIKITYAVFVVTDTLEMRSQHPFAGQDEDNFIGIGVAQAPVSPLRTGLLHVVLVIGIPLRDYRS